MEVGDVVKRVRHGGNGHMSVGSIDRIKTVKYSGDSRGFILERCGSFWHDEIAYELYTPGIQGFGKLNNFRKFNRN